MNIRILLPDDLQNGFLESLESLKPTGLSPEEALNVYWHRNSSTHTYVAIEDGKVIGTATLLLERKFINRGGMVGHIEDVAVHKDKQGCGVGKKLVDYLIEVAKGWGCYKVILDCAADLIPYYSKLGFKEWSTGMRIDLPH